MGHINLFRQGHPNTKSQHAAMTANTHKHQKTDLTNLNVTFWWIRKVQLRGGGSDYVELKSVCVCFCVRERERLIVRRSTGVLNWVSIFIFSFHKSKTHTHTHR